VKPPDFHVDPVTVEVIGNALLSVAEEMGEALVRAAYSDNIKERRDCSTAIFDVRGRTLAQAAHIPIHLGSLLGVVEAVLRHHPLEDIHDGDMFIGNDPYAAGGTHLPDIVMTGPVFYEGKLAGFVANLGHHGDFFDRGEGRHIWQEGLRIPALRIVDRGTIRQDVMDFILLNCQLPNERVGDFRAQLAANRLGIRRMQELLGRHGAEQFSKTMEDLLDATERRMRTGIASIQDGTYVYEDYLDSDYLESNEPLRLVVRIDKRLDQITLDFTGCPAQGPHPLNMNWNATLATCYYALKTVVDPDLPPNDGLCRPIKVVAVKGSILHCIEPAAVDARTQTAQRVVDLIHGALAPAIPDRITAAHNGANSSLSFYGTDPRSNTQFQYAESIGGGFGARAHKDGLDGVQVHVTNTENLPVEALENAYPLLARRYELVTDSGGPGTYRGGMGIARYIEVVEGPLVGWTRMTRAVVAPWGLFGGKLGGRGRVDVVRANGAVELPPRGIERRGVLLHAGDGLVVTTPGGGGYGDPLKRDRERVLRDLREERISRRAATDDYGLTPEDAVGPLEGQSTGRSPRTSGAPWLSESVL